MNCWHFDNQLAPKIFTPHEQWPESGYFWLDASYKDFDEAQKFLKKYFNTELHESHVRDCINSNHPYFYDSMQNYELIIFRQLKGVDADEVFTSAIAFIVLDRVIVSLTETPSETEFLRQKYLPSGRKYPPSSHSFAYAALTLIVDNFLNLKQPLSEEYDQWQTLMIKEMRTMHDWEAFMGFKNKISQLEAIADAQQDVVEQWREDFGDEISENFDVKLKDLDNHILRIIYFTQQMKRELDALVQLHFTAIGHRTNEIVRVLTLVSVIFMPLTLISGIFGMNFKFMPTLDLHYGYYLTLIGMVILSLILLIIFKIKKWF